MTRRHDGVAVIDLKQSTVGDPVVLADAVALLSGVNFNSVEKVIAAIEAIAEFAGMDMKLLIRLDDIPTHRVIPNDPAYSVRANATRSLCEEVAKLEVSQCTEAADILRLRERFS